MSETSTPDPLVVELVNDRGDTIGATEKLAAHLPPGLLHRAFSVFLLDDSGRILMQRRADEKYHSPGVWSNSCCGHPEPGVTPAVAAARRITEELGVRGRDLAEAGITRYRHVDPISGLVEKEFNHTFVGLVDGEPDPDPDEVSAVAFLQPDHLETLRAEKQLSVWFDSVFAVARPLLNEMSAFSW